ncbi:MAG: glucose-1-phosphate thymidylyltransferase RfbA [Verrucomicrobiota bacterium]|nr:glucose-1-phosphate thymidylyltransferase RfbA [Verrucomicrobiota bacterium]
MYTIVWKTYIRGQLKGIILAGGSGTRLAPATLAVCKQLLPIYDKPMIYYPLSVLMMGGIREILVISTPEETPRFERLLGDGSQLGLSFTYVSQPSPRGIAEAILLGAPFIGNESVALILGDNLFYGHDFARYLTPGINISCGAHIFGYPVKDPERYGVIEYDSAMRPLSIEEKPSVPKSSYAIPGLYFYGPEVVAMAHTLTPSSRGELEITDLHRLYLEQGKLSFSLFDPGIAWLDAGTFEAYLQASLFVQTIQERQGIKIACIEEIAWRKGYIDREALLRFAQRFAKNEYGEYLLRLSKYIPKMTQE